MVDRIEVIRFLVAVVLLTAALATTPAALKDSTSAKASDLAKAPADKTAAGSAEWVARQVRDRNISFLVWEHPDADDERFLYLPALGRVRRIAGQEKDQSVVGSALSYEDIGGRDIADYTYALPPATRRGSVLTTRVILPDCSNPGRRRRTLAGRVSRHLPSMDGVQDSPGRPSAAH